MIIFTGLDLTFLVLYMNFRWLRIEITEDWITASFGVIKKRISLQDVISCEFIHAGYDMFGGPGIRFGGDGSLAFLASMGDAVRLIRKQGRYFVFSTGREIEVRSLIDALIQERLK